MPETPFPLPEANIQAEFYHHCRLIGLPCILEFITPAGRHDACIFSKDYQRLYAIVECKREGKSISPFQMARYKQVGVAIRELNHFDQAKILASMLSVSYGGLVAPGTGISLEELKKIVPIKRRGARIRRRKVHYIDIDQDLIIRP